MAGGGVGFSSSVVRRPLTEILDHGGHGGTRGESRPLTAKDGKVREGRQEKRRRFAGLTCRPTQVLSQLHQNFSLVWPAETPALLFSGGVMVDVRRPTGRLFYLLL